MEHCVVLLVTGPPEGLVISAVRSGVFLTVAQLKSLHAVIKFKLPEKGSGKNGNIIKVDWVRALVNHYFGDSPEDIRMNMMKGMLGQSWKHLNPGRASKHSGDILRAFNGIDVADMKEYVDIAQVAADEEVLKEKRLQRERKVGYHMAARKHFTPKVLKEVIPAECRISRHPPLKRYQAFYGTEDRQYSHATYWHGKKHGLTEGAALVSVVQWAWQVHRKLNPLSEFEEQPKRDEKGNFQGYEMVTCKWPTWNNETQAHDLPPLKKCQKIRLVNLQVLASEENYLEIEELSSSEDVKPSVSGGSPGLVLSLVTKIARMMFVRHTATISAPDEKTGEGRFCKDMWTPGQRPEKSYAVGVECKAKKTGEFDAEDQDEVGDGVDARFEFEFVELQPVWNEAKKKNQQLIGIRGGYNLQWCRVLSEASKTTNLKAGSVVCDLELPLQEGTSKLLNATLPIEAQFRLEQTGKNDIPSNVIISSDASQDSCDGNCEADEEKTKEEVSEDLSDAAGVEQTLEIRLVSMMTQKYCKTTLQSFKKWNGLRTTKKILLACDTDTEASDHNLLSLWGSTDGLTPSKYWNFIIVLSLSCLGGTIGWTGSSWASLLGGVGVVFTFASTLVGTAAGVAGGIYFTDYLTNSYHIDGIMLRYMMNDKLQTVGQQILYMIESALDFEYGCDGSGTWRHRQGTHQDAITTADLEQFRDAMTTAAAQWTLRRWSHLTKQPAIFGRCFGYSNAAFSTTGSTLWRFSIQPPMVNGLPAIALEDPSLMSLIHLLKHGHDASHRWQIQHPPFWEVFFQRLEQLKHQVTVAEAIQVLRIVVNLRLVDVELVDLSVETLLQAEDEDLLDLPQKDLVDAAEALAVIRPQAMDIVLRVLAARAHRLRASQVAKLLALATEAQRLESHSLADAWCRALVESEAGHERDLTLAAEAVAKLACKPGLYRMEPSPCGLEILFQHSQRRVQSFTLSRLKRLVDAAEMSVKSRAPALRALLQQRMQLGDIDAKQECGKKSLEGF
eukprot:symbB.v1.2.019580.t1/scaffold1585.1/size110488/1